MPSLTRRQLHSLVWTEQLDAAARILAISPSRVRSLCRSNEINLPPPGYWAKVAAGAPPKRRDLRIDTLRAEAIVMGYGGAAPREAVQAQEHRVSPTDDPPTIAADFKPTTTLAKAAMGATRSYGEMLHLKTEGIELKVSPPQRARCAALVEALVLAGEEAGWHVGEKIIVDGEVMMLELRERTTAPYADGGYVLRSEYLGTGDLVLSVPSGKYTGARHNWSDTRRSQIEQRLAKIVGDFSILSAVLKEQRREREEQSRRWVEQERIRKEERRLADIERVRGAIFLEQAETFDLTQRLRSYVEAVKRRVEAAEETDERTTSWLSWAERHIAGIDPLAGSLPILVADEEALRLSWRYCELPG